MSISLDTRRGMSRSKKLADIEERAELVRQSLAETDRPNRAAYYRGYLRGLRHAAQLSGVGDVNIEEAGR